MRNPLVLGALMLLGAATACGGRSSGKEQPEPVGPPSEFADAVLFVADDAFDVDFLGVRIGEKRTFPFGKAYGTSLWSPDRRRMFVEESQSEFAIFTVDGRRHPLDVTNGYSFSWSWDGQRSAMELDGEMAIAGANAEDAVPLPLRSIVPTTSTAWSPDGSTVAFSTDVNVAIVDVGASSAQIIPVDDRAYAYWAPDSAAVAIMTPSSLQIVTGLGAPLLAFSGAGQLVYGWSHDGAHFALGECLGDAAIATLGESELVRLGTTSCRALWSPTEARLGYSADGGIKVWSGDDGTIATVAPVAEAWSWSWSPDGAMMAAFDVVLGESRIVDSHDGVELGRVPGTVVWNAAGTRLLFYAPNPDIGRQRVFTASGTGNDVKELTDQAEAFVWLPDDDHLAFTTATEAFTIHADGSERTRVATALTPNSFGWVAPQSPCPACWSP